MAGYRCIFVEMENNKIVESLKLDNDKEAIKYGSKISKTINEQVMVFRGIAIVDERPSMRALFEAQNKRSEE